jgi:hypothetical protein
VTALEQRGLAIAPYCRTRHAQHGVSLALLNIAHELHGVQVGLLNWAGNQPWPWRLLPLLNVHRGA